MSTKNGSPGRFAMARLKRDCKSDAKYSSHHLDHRPVRDGAIETFLEEKEVAAVVGSFGITRPVRDGAIETPTRTIRPGLGVPGSPGRFAMGAIETQNLYQGRRTTTALSRHTARLPDPRLSSSGTLVFLTRKLTNAWATSLGEVSTN